MQTVTLCCQSSLIAADQDGNFWSANQWAEFEFEMQQARKQQSDTASTSSNDAGTETASTAEASSSAAWPDFDPLAYTTR